MSETPLSQALPEELFRRTLAVIEWLARRADPAERALVQDLAYVGRTGPDAPWYNLMARLEQLSVIPPEDRRTREELDQAGRELSQFFAQKNWSTSVSHRRRPGGECRSGGCRECATHRVRLNLHGTAVEADVCKAHAHHEDGSSRDGSWADKI